MGLQQHEQKILEVELSVQKTFDRLTGAIETNHARVEGQLFKRDFEITFKKNEPDTPSAVDQKEILTMNKRIQDVFSLVRELNAESVVKQNEIRTEMQNFINAVTKNESKVADMERVKS